MLNKRLFKKPNIALEGAEDLQANPQAADPLIECTGCKVSIPSTVLFEQHYVCPRCGAILPFAVRERLRWLCDEGSFQEMDADLQPEDRLHFPQYQEKLEKARKESGEPEGVVTGTAMIDGMPCALFLMNGQFIMGSMGAVVGEKITRLFEHATEHKLPVIGYTMSGGARIQEGIFSLMQMAKTSGAVLRHSQAELLYIAVLTHPTTGGVTASFAMEADIILAEPKAQICFTGPRIIEQTMRQTLPEGLPARGIPAG